MNTYPASNAEAQMTHAAWDAAPPFDYDALDRWEREHGDVRTDNEAINMEEQ